MNLSSLRFWSSSSFWYNLCSLYRLESELYWVRALGWDDVPFAYTSLYFELAADCCCVTHCCSRVCVGRPMDVLRRLFSDLRSELDRSLNNVNCCRVRDRLQNLKQLSQVLQFPHLYTPAFSIQSLS